MEYKVSSLGQADLAKNQTLRMCYQRRIIKIAGALLQESASVTELIVDYEHFEKQVQRLKVMQDKVIVLVTRMACDECPCVRVIALDCVSRDYVRDCESVCY